MGKGSPTRTKILRRKFSRAILKILNITVHLKGEIPELDGTLYVSNHKSMIDPIIFLAYESASPVAKAPIAKYPLLGKAAEDTGIIFVNRSSDKSRSDTRRAIEDSLEGGENVLIYPEGTISKEEKLLPFKKGSFEVAAAHGYPVCPVQLVYPDSSYYWTSGSLLNHFKTAFVGRKTAVTLSFYPVLTSSDGQILLDRSYDLLNRG